MSLELNTFRFNKTRLTVAILIIELLSAYGVFTGKLAGAEVDFARQQVVNALEGKSENDRSVLKVIEEFLQKRWGAECLWPDDVGVSFWRVISLREELLFAV